MPEEMSGKICVPGLRLGQSNKEYASGPGTYELQGYIYAALAGVLKMEENKETKIIKLSVESQETPSVVPKPGDIVTAKVTYVNSRQVITVIIAAGQTILKRGYKGILKKEDIKSTDKDRINPYKCYRMGDVILARVLPMTETHWYPLSTAENELGVAVATGDNSKCRSRLIPISWSEMQCPVTLIKEPRKVARIVPENLNQPLPSSHSNGVQNGN